MSQKGTLYFFTGLSGAGKTTIGGLFYRRMKARKNDVVLFDGDLIRGIFGGGGYSTEARLDTARRYFRMARTLTDQGIDVVMCCIAMYHEIRAWSRENIANYREIYLRVSRETLYRRDQKQLYSSNAKQVVGVDLPWDEPTQSDLIIDNNGEETPEEIVERIERVFFGEGGQ